jgi:hypothetical protein
MINTAHDFNQLPAAEQELLFTAWNKQTICRLLATADNDSTIRQMADAAGWEGLTPPAHPEGWEWDADKWDFIDPTPPPEPEVSVWERVKSIADQFPKADQIRFPFEKYDYYRRLNDAEGARLVIDTFDVSDEPSNIQQARIAILAEFDK